MADGFISKETLLAFNEDHDVSLNEKALQDIGGVSELEKRLHTNFKTGLVTDPVDFERRRSLYGSNEIPQPPAQTWIQMFLESFEDTTIIVLVVAAVVSLAVGIYEDPAKGWLEGAAILSSVFIVAIVTATNNYNKEQQFRKLNAVKDDTVIGVHRDGKVIQLHVKELLVGDIIILNCGDKIPADGVLLSGSDVVVNESALTGESEDKVKVPNPQNEHEDRFLLSGTSLCTGYGLMLVTAVGASSRWGKTKSKLASESPDTPLQEKLEVLAGQIGNVGLGSAVATFLAMIFIWIRYPDTRSPDSSFFDFILEAFIMGVTIVVVAVPEGLPLAVTLSLAYSTKKMQKDNNLIRVLEACETMGNATNICSDKTGTLTENRMTVVAGTIGGSFYNDIFTLDGTLTGPLQTYISEGIAVNTTASLTVDVEIAKAATEAGTLVPDSAVTVNGNKTEGALLFFIKNILHADYKTLRQSLFDERRGDKLFTFTSDRKRMTVLLISNPSTNQGISYTKGASEVILSLCNYYTDLNGKTQSITPAIRNELESNILTMAKEALRTIALAHRVISNITGQETADDVERDLVLDAIVGIKDPLRPSVKQAVQECQAAGIFVRMVTGDNIETAVAIAKECGIYTEGGLAMEGPIFRKMTPKELDEVIPRLQVLARSSPEDKYILVCRLNGNALPETREQWELIHPHRDWETERDLVLPGYLEEWQQNPIRQQFGGEVVGATGDGTNDAPALKAADVGLSMGLSGTDVAKDASDIVILDDNFSSIVKAVTWGRSVFDNIRKFLQFQLTVNLVALTLTFMSAVRGQSPPLNAVMMLWVNLIMDTMGALALGTEPPSPTLLLRRPYKRNASLISNSMIRNILVQYGFQILLLTYLMSHSLVDFEVISPEMAAAMSGTPPLPVKPAPTVLSTFRWVISKLTFEKSIESVADPIQSIPKLTEHHILTKNTILFNTFVFCQLFNELNSRSISNEMNIFNNLFQNHIFILIIFVTIAVQYLIVEFGSAFVRTTTLTPEQWIKCILLGALSLPLGGFMRLIPVFDDENDFAVLPEILRKKSGEAKLKLMDNKNFITKEVLEEKKRSFQIWLFLVTIIPLLTYYMFEDHWEPHLQYAWNHIADIALGRK